MNFTRRFFRSITAIALLGSFSIAFAADHPYSEGPVVNVASIRTEYGRFDDYMNFLATTWKQEMEASKKAGLILSYEVMQVEPRGPDDPDIYLITTYKNWAALDGMTEKLEGIDKQIYGSQSNANKGAVDRGKMRRTLGSETMQVLDLK